MRALAILICAAARRSADKMPTPRNTKYSLSLVTGHLSGIAPGILDGVSRHKTPARCRRYHGMVAEEGEL